MEKSIKLMEAEHTLLNAVTEEEQTEAVLNLLYMQEIEADENIRLSYDKGVTVGTIRAAAFGLLGLGLGGGVSKLLARK